MKRCLSCDASYASSHNNCTSCGFAPTVMDGYDSYAPEFAHDGGGFKADYFVNLARLEEENFWFRSRNQLISGAIGTYCKDFKSMLEIGCGTGYVLSGLSQKFPDSRLLGSEIFIAGLGFANERLPSAKFMQMDGRNIPFEREFDVIGAFDVLEHIKEDEKVFRQIYQALNPDGFMIITVPQHAWLWSSLDEYACHERRYANAELIQKIGDAGFRIIRNTSFVTTLLPAMMISRLFQKKLDEKQLDPLAELKISPWLNSLFYQLLSAERMLIKSGINFPVGGSRLVVAKKV